MTVFVRLLAAVFVIISWPVFGQDGSSQASLSWDTPLVIVQGLWMALIAIGAPLYSKWACKRNGESTGTRELRGLNLPRGSIRSMLALLAVGSFVNVLVLGSPVLGNDFDNILAAFGTLTGSIIGFYFGNRSATPLPTNEPN